MRKMNDYEKAVKIALILKDMSMAELAGELGISKPYLYDIISGARTAMKIRERINTMLGIEDEIDHTEEIRQRSNEKVLNMIGCIKSNTKNYNAIVQTH